MSVKVRPFRGREGKYEVDIRFEWPDGDRYRERIVAPVSSLSAARKWGDARERERLLAGPQKTEEVRREPAPRLSEFRARYIEQHCRAERQKPSTTWNKERAFEVYLVPHLNDKRLDEITNADVQTLKAKLAHLSPKTVNNILTILSVVLKKAAEWGVIDDVPCSIKLLRWHGTERPFYDFDDYARLLEGAECIGGTAEVLVLLAGDAGLRLGEITALKWHNVLFDRRIVRVAEADWKAHTTLPKGGRSRDVPMTDRLLAALEAHRHLRGNRVLYAEGGAPLTMRGVRNLMQRVERRAGLEVKGRLHILRHTFCSHLAILGAPAKAIQELAGHAELTTTMRYMHLSPAARSTAIGLLNGVDRRGLRGDLGETKAADKKKPCVSTGFPGRSDRI